MEKAPIGLRRHAANGITALRIGATPLFVFAVDAASRGAPAWPAAALYALAAASDFTDGRVARHLGVESRRGRLFDHFADIAFLAAALTLYAAIGTVPWWVPFSVGASFAVYAGDSWWRGDGPSLHLIGSRVGHLAGIANYVLVGTLVFNETVGLGWLPPPILRIMFWLVPIYSGAAIFHRLAPRR